MTNFLDSFHFSKFGSEILEEFLVTEMAQKLHISLPKFWNTDRLNSVTNKITIHACDVAGQQIALAIGSAAASNTIINLLILNVRVLNVNTKAAGITTKMAVGYIAWSLYMMKNNTIFEPIISFLLFLWSFEVLGNALEVECL